MCESPDNNYPNSKIDFLKETNKILTIASQTKNIDRVTGKSSHIASRIGGCIHSRFP